MSLDTPTREELIEQYRAWAHKCVFNTMYQNKTIESAEDYIKNISEIIDNVIDGVLKMATEIDIDEMRDKIQQLLNP